MTAKMLIPNNKQLLADAWHLVKETKWCFFLLFLISMIWGCIILLLIHMLKLDSLIKVHMNDWGMILLPMMSAIASVVFFLGATSMGIARARGQEVSLKIAFKPWRKSLKIITILFSVMIINLLIGNLVNGIGFAAAVATKQTDIIYVTIIIADLIMVLINALFLIAIPITIDTHYGPFKSMYLSLSHMRQHWWQYYLLVLLLYILAFLSVFTLFIAYLWLLPLSFILFGQLYLRLIPPQTA